MSNINDALAFTSPIAIQRTRRLVLKRAAFYRHVIVARRSVKPLFDTGFVGGRLDSAAI